MVSAKSFQGPCYAIQHTWGLAKSAVCECGQQQTMNHVVNIQLSWNNNK